MNEETVSDAGSRSPPRLDGIGPFSRRHLLAMASALVATVAILLFITVPIGGRAPATSSPAPGASFFIIGQQQGALESGSPAPDFVGADGTRLTDLEGMPVTLEELRGRPVWVFFWATWCPPCQQETPDIQRMWESRGDDLVILAIDVQEPREVVDEYRQAYDLTYRIGLDTTASAMATWNVFGLPTHYFIDRQGIIRDRQFGPLTLDQMDERIDIIVGAAR